MLLLSYCTCFAHPMIVPCCWPRQVLWWQRTQMMMWWRSCDDPNDHWWQSCDNPSDYLKMTLMIGKMTADYLVMIFLTNLWRPWKNWWWHLMKIYNTNWQLLSLKSKGACLADLKNWLQNIFLFVTGKNEVPVGNEGNNLSLHHLQTLVVTLWRVNISRWACSTWTLILLEMENCTGGRT